MKLPAFMKTSFRVIAGLILLGVILLHVDVKEVGTLFLNVRWPWVIGAALIIFVLRLIMSLRWQILLTSQGIHVTMKELVWITFVSFFFGQFLPGGVGVDMAKGYHLISRRGQTASVTATLLLDHFIGLLTMLLVAFLGTVPDLLAAKANPFALPIFLALATVVIGWYAGYYAVRRWNPSRWVVTSHPLGARAFRGCMKILTAITDLEKIRPVFLPLFGWATLVILMRCSLFYFIFRAFATEVPILACLTIIPLVYLAMLLPLTAGGLGVREGTMTFFFLPLGVPAAVSVSVGLLSHLIGMAVSLLGLFFWVRGGRDSKVRENS